MTARPATPDHRPHRRRRHRDGHRPSEKPAMEPISEALALLKRQARIQESLRRGRGNPVLEERELYLIRQQLIRYPAALQAIALTAAELHRPIELVSVREVEKRC